jgi:hypothetical protein
MLAQRSNRTESALGNLALRLQTCSGSAARPVSRKTSGHGETLALEGRNGTSQVIEQVRGL